MRRYSDEFTIMTAKTATGIGNWMLVEDWRHITADIDFATSPTMTIKCVGSISDDAPTPTSAQSASNRYDFMEMIDLQSGSDIDGDTGIAVAGSSDHRQVNINTDGLKWITFYITSYSAGNASVKAKGFAD